LIPTHRPEPQPVLSQGLLNLQELLAKAATSPVADGLVAKSHPNDPIMYVYTSGTTGKLIQSVILVKEKLQITADFEIFKIRDRVFQIGFLEPNLTSSYADLFDIINLGFKFIHWHGLPVVPDVYNLLNLQKCKVLYS
jgi:hypothetical protein